MPSKKYMTVGTRVTEKEFAELEIIANRENISISAMMRLFIQAIINDDIELEKGELKICTPPHEDCVSDDFYSDDFGKRVEKKFDRLRERGCPESYINIMKEELLSSIDSRIDMMPKKFTGKMKVDTDIYAP